MKDVIGGASFSRPLLVDAQEIDRIKMNAADLLDVYVVVSWCIAWGAKRWRMDHKMYETEDAARDRVRDMADCHRLAVIFRLRVERP